MSSKRQKIFPTWYDYNHIKTNHITHPMKIGWCSIYHNANNIVLFVHQRDLGLFSSSLIFNT